VLALRLCAGQETDDTGDRQPLQGSARTRARRLRWRTDRGDGSGRLKVRLLSPPPLDTACSSSAGSRRMGAVVRRGSVAAASRPARARRAESARLRAGVWASQHYPASGCTLSGLFRLRAAPPRADGLRIFSRACGYRHRRRPGCRGRSRWWRRQVAVDTTGRARLPGLLRRVRGRRVMLLGELQAHLNRLVRVGEPARDRLEIGRRWRKHYAGTASSTRTGNSVQGEGDVDRAQVITCARAQRDRARRRARRPATD